MYGGAPEQLRYMYGLGGLADVPYAFNVLDAGAVRAAVQQATQAVPQQVASAQATIGAVPSCDCMLTAVKTAFSYNDTMMAQLRPLCATSPGQFLATAQAEAARRGIAVDFSQAACAQLASLSPWYRQPKYLALAGLGVLTAGYIAWKVL